MIEFICENCRIGVLLRTAANLWRVHELAWACSHFGNWKAAASGLRPPPENFAIHLTLQKFPLYTPQYTRLHSRAAPQTDNFPSQLRCAQNSLDAILLEQAIKV